jgi:hypothetical protein
MIKTANLSQFEIAVLTIGYHNQMQDLGWGNIFFHQKDYLPQCLSLICHPSKFEDSN